MYQHVVDSDNRKHQQASSGNQTGYRRRRHLHSHHHYQRIRLKSAPPSAQGLHSFNYHESMVVSGIGSSAAPALDIGIPISTAHGEAAKVYDTNCMIFKRLNNPKNNKCPYFCAVTLIDFRMRQNQC